MTERIQELALQAANEVADLFSPGFFDDRMVYRVAEINEKLAQLIVQECVAVVEDRGWRAPSDDDGYFKAATDMAATDIKRHFGVKR